MQITCESCHSKYNLADDKIKPTGTSVRCPKCSVVFKVFPPASEAEQVSCANCGKQTPAKPGMTVVFCTDCQRQLTDPEPGSGDAPAAGAAQDAGSAPLGDDPFSDDAAPPAAGNGDFDDGGLFDDAPAAPSPSGGLFDDDDGDQGGGGLFEDAPDDGAGADPFGESAPPAADGGLFDDGEPDGGGLFDDAPQGQEDDPFGDFSEPAGDPSEDPFGEEAPAASSEADPFGDFSEPAPGAEMGDEADPFGEPAGGGDDDLGFSDPGESDPFGDDESEEPAAEFKPVREKKAPKITQKAGSPIDVVVDAVRDYGARVGMIIGALAVIGGLGLVVAMAFLPETFDARPPRGQDQPGFLSSTSFSLQKMMETSYYGQAMQDAFLVASEREMATWSGEGFGNAAGELRQLLSFDGANRDAKTALVNVYATWGLVEETDQHADELVSLAAEADPSPEVQARMALVLGNFDQVRVLAPQLGHKAPLYLSMVSGATGAITDAVPGLRAYTAAQPEDFLGALSYAHLLRDQKEYAAAISAYERASALVGGNAKASLEIGKMYFGPLEDWGRASTALEDALNPARKGSPTVRAEAAYRQARILHERGRGSDALARIESALAHQSDNPHYLTTLADIQHESGRIVDAFQNYERARNADPEHIDAHIGLGLTNERLDKPDEAVASFETALSIDSGHPRANMLFAQMMLRRGDMERAETILKDALSLNPRHPPLVDNLASFYVNRGELDEALRLYTRLTELAPDELAGYVGRGVVLVEQGDLGRAKQMFQRAARIDTENPDVLYRLGQTAYLEGDLATAQSSLERALDRKPTHWESRLYLGMARASQEEYDEALTEYQRALDMNARAAEVYRQRALVYWKQSKQLEGAAAKTRADSAVREMDEALRYDPDNADYYFDYGVILDSAGVSGRARDAWIRAIELRPTFREAQFRLAKYYLGFMQHDNAEELLRDILRHSPRDDAAHLEMARVYLATGRLDEAQRQLTRVVNLNSRNADAFHMMGVVLLRKGMAQQARSYFERALQVQPRHSMAHFQLGLYFKDRSPERSRTHFQTAVDSGNLSQERLEEANIALRELQYMQ